MPYSHANNRDVNQARWVLIALTTLAVILSVLVLISILYGNQQSCERYNLGLRQREMMAHRVLGSKLSCPLFFPQS